MRKLLMYISYLGTNYQGLQLLTSRTVKGDLRRVVPEYHTVQGVLEQALRKVLQLNEVAVHNSSRTDSGVHALSSTVQFEVSDNDFSVSPFSPEKICMSLNYFLEKHQTDIRIQRVAEVPIEFNCRNAYSRTYNYRIALAKTNDFENCYSFMKLSAFMPITELYKAQVVPQPFDVEAVQQACRVFLGKWNFRSFATFATTSIKGRGNREPLKEEDLIKTIFKFSFSKSKIDFENFDVPTYYYRDPACNKLDFYDFHVEGSGFLRRQVRRMVGILLGVGRGIISSNDILQLLSNPNDSSWPGCISGSLPEGLFLKSVNYKHIDILRGPLS